LGQVLSRASRSGFAVVLGFVILLFFPEILCKMPQNCGGIAGSAFERRDASRPPPAVSALHTDDDVFIEEAGVLEETDGGFRSKFIGSEFANADEIPQPLGGFRFNEIEKRIQSVDLAAGRRFAILRERFELGFHEFSESAIFETFDDRSCPLERKVKDSPSRNKLAAVVDFSQQRGFLN